MPRCRGVPWATPLPTHPGRWSTSVEGGQSRAAGVGTVDISRISARVKNGDEERKEYLKGKGAEP